MIASVATLVSQVLQSPGHLERDDAAHRPAAQVVRALGLNLTKRFHVAGRHRLDGLDRLLSLLESRGLKRVERMVWVSIMSQVKEAVRDSSRGMNAEERSARGRPVEAPPAETRARRKRSSQAFGQIGDGRAQKQACQWQLAAELLLDLREHANRQERMALPGRRNRP